MQKNLYRFYVDVIYTDLPTIWKCDKSMQLTPERELDLHASKSEPQDVEQPQDEDHGVGTTTHVENFVSDGQRECMKLYHQVRGGVTCMSNPKNRYLGKIH